MTLRNLHRVLLLLVITFPLTGCLFRSHKVQPREVSKAPLKTTTQAELIEYVNTQAARVQSMQATVDIDTSVGGVKKGKVTNYEIDVIRRGEHGWFLARKILFSRTDLLPHRQLIYNPNGDLVSDIHYESYKDFSGVNFPSIIEIWRPQEEYDITLSIVKLQLNEPLPNDKFTLEQPPGAQVVRLDQPPTKTPPGGDGK